MLNAKFQNHRPTGSEELLKVFAVYSHGGNLYKLSFPFHKVWLSSAMWLQRCLNILVICMYIAPGQEQTNPWGLNVFININLQYLCMLIASVPHLITFNLFSPFKCMGDLS